MTNNISMKVTKNISPLRYPGGKTRACKLLDIILNEHFDIKSFSTLVSPFFGGGSFEFYIQNKYQLKVLANDKFTPLYNFWTSCKLDKDKLAEALYKKINTIKKDDFISLREEIMDEYGRRYIIAVDDEDDEWTIKTDAWLQPEKAYYMHSETSQVAVSPFIVEKIF